MKNRTLLPQDSTAERLEIARVRAEVQRALHESPPDLDVLMAALERVDTLIENAQAELVAAVRELQPLPRRSAAVPETALASEAPVSCFRQLLPW